MRRLAEEEVAYVWVGGHAVCINGLVRSTEDIDLLLLSSVENGRQVIAAPGFLPSSSRLRPEWFEVNLDEPDHIRVADELLTDLLLAVRGQTCKSLRPRVRRVMVRGVPVTTLDIDGLLKTKTDYRDKNRIDREALTRLKHAWGWQRAALGATKNHPCNAQPRWTAAHRAFHPQSGP